jgi:catechol 2,3-dioxygenase-like lactoylglutathione lyase family enzyme
MPAAEAAGSGDTANRTGVELHVADVERSLAFYEALGFKVARRWEDWIRLDRDGADLVLFGDAYVRGKDHYFTPHIDRSPRGIGVEIVIEVNDVDALYATAREAGLQIVKEMQERPWKARDFRLADPDGYFLRITSLLHGR